MDENPQPQRNNTLLFIVLGCLGLAVGAACLIIVIAAGLVALSRERAAADQATRVALVATQAALVAPATAVNIPEPLSTTTPTPKNTPAPANPAAEPTALSDDRADEAVPAEINGSLEEASLAALLAVNMPPHDYFETAVRLGRQDVGSRTVDGAAYALGDDRLFQTDRGVIRATLRAVTDHAYFWVEDDVPVDEVAVAVAADRFERDLYPPISALFGEEWRPGVDGDPHFSILHLRDFGDTEDLGFFSASDEFPRAINVDSNEQEIIYLNLNYLDIGDDLYFGVLVHELEHLIHWHMDPNETTWLDEGLAQLGEVYLNFDSASTGAYLRRAETQLNRWALDDEDAAPHYAASYLFAVYFWEQLGDAAVQRLARHPADGMRAVHAVLAEFRPDLTLEQFMANWVAANYLDDATAGAPFTYDTFDLRRPNFSVSVNNPSFEKTLTVAPFAAQYIELAFGGPTTIAFAGDTRTPLLPVPPHGGERVWLAQGPHNSNAQMTAVFDLTNAASASLDFWAWYDLEADWDFAYLAASADEGATWTLLVPDHAAAGLYGPAYNGRSAAASDAVNGWVQESVSLNAYAGRPVWLRFELLTDGSVTSAGFAVDDITLKAAGYSGDAEGEDGRWQKEGFALVGQYLPQRWSVQLLEEDATGSQVASFILDGANQGSVTVNLGAGGGVLAVIPLTPFTRVDATYQLTISAP